MLDIKYIRDNSEKVKKGVQDKNCVVPLDELIRLDTERKMLLQKVEEIKAQQNKANQEMARLKKEGKDFSEKVIALRELSQECKEKEGELTRLKEKCDTILVMIPNIPHESVPVGSEKDNVIIRQWGTKKEFSFTPKDHVALCEKNNMLDMPRAAKITGRGFVLYTGLAARLERALINFMLDFHTQKHGYLEVSPPFLVNRESMYGTGQLPKLEEDMYALKNEDFFLIPTAEVPVTNIHRDDVLKEEDLPIKYVAYTPCFRREAGSYGKETRGLSRVHQFDKVEMVQFVKPEESFRVLEGLVDNAEAILQALEIPYRIVSLATGDLSFAASKCYDIEIWAAGSKTWYEVSSCSNFCDFQARRANIKYKTREGKQQFVHTLNGSGVALARLFIALVENNQKEDGTFEFPQVLQPYMRCV
jgi:seryl-tRNA synthetase